jgi:hypothetical protein
MNQPFFSMSQPPQVNRATKPPEFFAQNQFYANGADPNDWWALQTKANYDTVLDDSGMIYFSLIMLGIDQGRNFIPFYNLIGITF